MGGVGVPAHPSTEVTTPTPTNLEDLGSCSLPVHLSQAFLCDTRQQHGSRFGTGTTDPWPLMEVQGEQLPHRPGKATHWGGLGRWPHLSDLTFHSQKGKNAPCPEGRGGMKPCAASRRWQTHRLQQTQSLLPGIMWKTSRSCSSKPQNIICHAEGCLCQCLQDELLAYQDETCPFPCSSYKTVLQGRLFTSFGFAQATAVET